MVIIQRITVMVSVFILIYSIACEGVMLGTVSTFYDVDAVLIAVSFLTMIIKIRKIIVPINVHGLRSRLESLLE